MANRIIFSGIQPSGNLHIGNYYGAIKHWAAAQKEEGSYIYCIVDLHAVTVEQDPAVLRENTLEMAAMLLACGIDPEKSILFIQSQNPDHANLGWLLNCNVSMGEMNRMTQFKEKSEKKQFVSVGLFDYPALMAADILLYDTTEVPVGEDQKQHVELTRDIAERFNGRYGETFVLPKPTIPKSGARVMSLTDPTKKMSKSDENANSRVHLLDSADEIRKKFKSAVTDTGSGIIYNKEEKPGISNLIEIYANAVGKEIQEVEKEFANSGYAEFKSSVADAVTKDLESIQQKYNELRNSSELEKILKEGSRKAYKISHKKLEEVYGKIGFIK